MKNVGVCDIYINININIILIIIIIHPFNISTPTPIRAPKGLLMSTKDPTNEEQRAAKC